MRPPRTLLAIALLLHCLPHFGQYQPVYKHLTVDEGLPASEVYHVFQDSQGYIWFATNNGVSRFDGYEFTNFDLVSGLTDNTVFEIYEDHRHRIWFIPFLGNLSYYEDGVIKQYAHNAIIRENSANSGLGPIKMSFHVDSLDNVLMGLTQLGLIRITPEGRCTKPWEELGTNYAVFYELPNGKILTSSPSSTLHGCRLAYLNGRSTQKFSFQSLFGRDFVPQYCFARKAGDGSIFISVNKHLVQIKNGRVEQQNHSIGELIIWMSIDEENNLWASPIEGGVYLFPGCDISKPPQRVLLKDFQVTSVLRDREGSYWFSTLNDGVFYTPNYKISVLSKESGLSDNRINAIYADRERVYVGFEMGFVDVITRNGIRHFSPGNRQASTSYVREIYGDTLSGRVWVSAFGELGYFEGLRYRRIGAESSTIYPRRVRPSRQGGYWVGTTRGLRRVVHGRITYDSRTNNELDGIVFSMEEEKSGTLWLNSLNGLYRYANGVYEQLGEKHSLLSEISHSMFLCPTDSTLWMGTNGAGIVLLGREGNVSQITTRNGLVSNSIHQIHHDNGRVWVATRQGMSLIADMHSNKITNFTIDDGLPSNEVTSVYALGRNVYIGTNKGLAIVDIEEFAKSSAPAPTIITRLTVEGQSIPLSDTLIRLTHRQNAIDLAYVGLAYKNMGELLYRHRMLGLGTSWAYTKSTSCLYSGLHSGEYTFQIQALNSSGVWNPVPTTLRLTVTPPFWERWWFITLALLALGGLVWLGFWARIRAIRRRNDLINNMNLYKQQSLRQQMNPHFIFNTLNSIQYYILERDTISSHKYLTKFARLMRMTLDNSQSPTVTLREEIDALRIYLELEALRLEGRFRFTIDPGSSEATLDVKIPTLLIQPFVENAIWHGIMPKPDKSGNVAVRISDTGSVVTCTVEDDGVGRQAARRLQEQSSRVHKSKGYQITQQRIDLLNTMYKGRFSIKIDDILDASNSPAGTRVSITIPKTLGLAL